MASKAMVAPPLTPVMKTSPLSLTATPRASSFDPLLPARRAQRQLPSVSYRARKMSSPPRLFNVMPLPKSALPS